MTDRIWDQYLTERDKADFSASGFGATADWGKRPALLVIDVNYAFCDEKPVDPVRIAVRVDETYHHFDRRSSSAIAKYALAFLRISFAWRNSRFSRSSAFIFSAISVGMPARWPLSISAFLTQSFRVCGVQPIFAAIDITACQRDGC